MTNGRRVAAVLVAAGLKGGDAGDAAADDEGVDVLGAFVGFDGFEVHHVAHDGVVVGNAIAAEDVACHAGAFEGHPDVVALGHGDVLEADLARVLELADVVDEELGLADFSDHPGEFFLNELMAGDGLVAELLALERVFECGVVAGHGRADGAPGDAVAGLVEAHERGFEAAGFGQEIGFGDVDVLQ